MHDQASVTATQYPKRPVEIDADAVGRAMGSALEFGKRRGWRPRVQLLNSLHSHLVLTVLLSLRTCLSREVSQWVIALNVSATAVLQNHLQNLKKYRFPNPCPDFRIKITRMGLRMPHFQSIPSQLWWTSNVKIHLDTEQVYPEHFVLKGQRKSHERNRKSHVLALQMSTSQTRGEL